MLRVRNKLKPIKKALAYYILFLENDCTNDDLGLWLLIEVEDNFFTMIEDESEKYLKIMNFNVRVCRII